jgi:phenylpyruvate tautomerase PptA (4-oxalocrotonate tautomerase family)
LLLLRENFIMPIITVKVFEDELTKNRTAEIIADITEAVIPYVGEAVRANTWVLVEEVKSGSGASAAMPWTRRSQADPAKRTTGSAALFPTRAYQQPTREVITKAR